MAAKVIANPVAVLGLRTKEFTTGLARAGASFKSFAGSITKFTGISTALSGVLGGIGIGALVKGQLEAVDATAKLSDRLGIATEKLVGLQHAASLAGVSNEELTNGIEKLLRNLPGGGTTEDAFKAMADQLAAMPNAFDRAKLATEVFGKSGQRLLPLLMQGAEGIRLAEKEAARLGITFSRVDAAKIEAANDAMTRAGAVVRGLATKLAVELAPYIEAVAVQFTNLGASGIISGADIAQGVGYSATAFAKLLDWFELVKAGWHALTGVGQAAIGYLMIPIVGLMEAVEGVYNVTVDVYNKLVEVANKLPGIQFDKLGKMDGSVSEGLNKFQEDIVADSKKSFAAAGDAATAFWNETNSKAAESAFADIRRQADIAAREIAKRAEEMNSGVGSGVSGMFSGLVASGLRGLNTLKEKFKGGLNAIGEHLKSVAEEQEKLFDEGKRIFEDTRTPLEKYNSELENLAKLFKAGAIDADTFARAQKKATEELNGGAATTPEKKMASLIGEGSAIQSGSAESMALRDANIRAPETDVADDTGAIKDMVQVWLDRAIPLLEEIKNKTGFDLGVI